MKPSIVLATKARCARRRKRFLTNEDCSKVGSLADDKGVRLSVGDWFDQMKLARAALVINAPLSARGSPSATVKATFERFASANTANVVFDIDERPSSQPSSNPH